MAAAVLLDSVHGYIAFSNIILGIPTGIVSVMLFSGSCIGKSYNFKNVQNKQRYYKCISYTSSCLQIIPVGLITLATIAIALICSSPALLTSVGLHMTSNHAKKQMLN